MAQNTSPIYTLVPDIAWSGNITSANTAVDGTGTVGTAFTAGANGSFVSRLRAKAAGTNVATVVRIFVNNGSTPGTASNNVLIGEWPLPAAAATNVTQIAPDIEYPLGFALPNGYKILVCIGTAVAAGWNFCCVGGDY